MGITKKEKERGMQVLNWRGYCPFSMLDCDPKMVSREDGPGAHDKAPPRIPLGRATNLGLGARKTRILAPRS